ncbi:Uncharacterised protein [Mycobacterium tuberculosis]|nr:Uncharacterised protein [Mycobacterium tuberculosis]
MLTHRLNVYGQGGFTPLSVLANCTPYGAINAAL